MFLNKLKLEVFKLLSKNPSYQHDVEYSVRKYKNTYKLGQEYDGLERIVDDSWNPFRLPRA
ncbi:MAG: hypothetical protein A2694_00570 [Candidatus Blackburnbacteria bacterium RIFCSPHIGHO2_01_FULL_40_17]|nr:MAG: hypothetical protein A2694_00570 [Candidatus Blackburnbacteria bacterium RIFCSPHIGHO2_01_FULL_40_17]